MKSIFEWRITRTRYLQKICIPKDEHLIIWWRYKDCLLEVSLQSCKEFRYCKHRPLQDSQSSWKSLNPYVIHSTYNVTTTYPSAVPKDKMLLIHSSQLEEEYFGCQHILKIGVDAQKDMARRCKLLEYFQLKLHPQLRWINSPFCFIVLQRLCIIWYRHNTILELCKVSKTSWNISMFLEHQQELNVKGCRLRCDVV